MLRAAAADLLWGSRCVACGLAGAPLCVDCASRPVPPPPRTLAAAGAALTVYAAGSYTDELADAVPAFKERELRALAAPLGDALARAVARGCPPGAARAWLVPVPPSRRSRRTRGFVPVHALARRAARGLRRTGMDVRLALGVLGYTRDVADQAGLGAGERARNLDGALEGVDGSLLAGLRRAGRRGEPLVLVDDVVTIGATLLEAARALAAVGVRVTAAAVVADTPLGHAR